MISYVTGDIFASSPPKQTLKAWDPLWDCVRILFEFQNFDVDEEHSEWRLYWVAGIALLRAIGHVLAKADALTSQEHNNAINKIWSTWKQNSDENKIFWEFIDNERNNILKTYTFGAELVQDKRGFYVTYLGGQDAFQLFREAVYWWRYQLITLEDDIDEFQGRSTELF